MADPAGPVTSFPVPRSVVPGVRWPAVPAPAPALLLAVVQQLCESQWWSPERLRAWQRRQLAEVVRHALRHVPFYRERARAYAVPGDGDPGEEWLAGLPVLERETVRGAGAALHAEHLPPEHGEVIRHVTAGSTSVPLEVRASRLTAFMGTAALVRDHLACGRDLGAVQAAITSSVGDERRPAWSEPLGTVYGTGPMPTLHVHHTVSEQAEWLARENPAYLVTYASNAHALARHCLERGIALPALREIRVTGEVMRDDLPDLCRAAFGARVTDVYSAEEAGVIAYPCPRGTGYHVQAETVLVEVLDGEGRPCPPGGTGSVVITPLHNLAMPLVRYRIGDYAEVAPPCPCGRGLPALARVAGRQRNMVVLPDGDRRWPNLRAALPERFAHVRRYQIVQHDLERVEVRVVADRPFDDAERVRLEAGLTRGLGHRFRYSVTYHDDIPRPVGHKLETFVSKVGG